MTRRLPPWGPPQPKNAGSFAVGAVLYYGLLIPLTSPVILMDYIRKRAQEAEYNRSEHGIEQQRRAEKETLVRKQKNTDKPQALPVPRPRALTLPILHPPEATKPDKSSWSLWSTPKVQQQTIIQSGSLLLTQLSADIRTLIWEVVIGGNTIEVFRGHGRLLHRLQDDDVDNSDYGLPMLDFYTDPPGTNILRLAKTCRQV
jgi:hypothetical protein